MTQQLPPEPCIELPSLNDLDLSPQGLADAPAAEIDPGSLVYIGNS